ncbi:hypothetical protein HPB48_004215 [Haemaphysalis longicornis]|uniref:Uncharacterized protein n=1 Tax=Haemaphysalis longicornis TaxID=44386 RepID=A0A9J6GD37_HAELO|nr:hypothetical protein HPB48_004215 [Haemaphysalis longicornis]
MDETSPHAVAPDNSSFVVPSQIPLPDDVDNMDQQFSKAFFCTKEDDEKNTAPWIEVTRRAQRKEENSTTPDAGTTPLKPAMKPTRNATLVSRKPRPPLLPENDYKMVIRPRNGLALSKISLTRLPAAFFPKQSSRGEKRISRSELMRLKTYW